MKFILLSILTFTLYQTGSSQNSVEPAFEILSEYPNVRDFTMSSSGNEGYVTIQSTLEEISVIAKIVKKWNIWLNPEIVSFSGKYKDIEPSFSPDGLRLYFASNRPLTESMDSPKDFDIWYIERENPDNPWSKPINIGEPINTALNEFYPSVVENKNLYFTSDATDSKGRDDIFFSKWNGNMYSPPVSLSDSINTDGYEFNAYVSPDESFMIFSGYNRADGIGSGDLYISFQDENQNWCAATNLGESINSKSMDYCPFVDLTSQTLFFTSRISAFSLVNDFQSIEDLSNEINQYENGLSRIYKVSVKEYLKKH
ncbi:MAG: hypothetical protein O2887_09735 [Bacteroidetes bacterium]|nr:hypothetical protein [Bacteroidota bacterium]MDA1120752.1 hypothetical protein [Bacteroidota bacterium]